MIPFPATIPLDLDTVASDTPAANEDIGWPTVPPTWSEVVAALARRLNPVTDLDAPDALRWDDPSLRVALQQFAGSFGPLGHGLEPGPGRGIDTDPAALRLALARTRARLRSVLAQARLARRAARHDGLTALPNRQGFGDRLDRSTSRAAATRPALALLYLDLDGFKAINDRHGHACGDALLRVVGARLRAALRPEDGVGRLGGDEFACLVKDMPDRAALEHLACKLGAVLAAPVRIGSTDLQVRASIGIAVWSGEGDSGESLMGRADQAMFRAKRLGCGHAFDDDAPAP